MDDRYNGLPIENPNVLVLSLQKLPFDVMFTGEKDKEFRRPSRITNRLHKNKFDYVEFRNGYGLKVPYFIAEYKGYSELWIPDMPSNCVLYDMNYSNGLSFDVFSGDYQINLGKIVKRGNVPICTWYKNISQLGESLSTKCGNKIHPMDIGGVHGFLFCPYCGKLIG